MEDFTSEEADAAKIQGCASVDKISPNLPVQKLEPQLPSLAFEGIRMEDFTIEEAEAEAVEVKMQGPAASVDPQREISRLVPPEAAEKSGGTSVSVDIEKLDEITWLDSIKEKIGVEPKRLKTSSSSEKCSIHRISNFFHHHEEKVRVPQIISIGPFHYDKRKDQLGAMEEHKWRYLHDILKRNPDDCLEQCFRAIKKLENEARECYSEEFDKLDSISFVEMLVLDGCFIIELFRRQRFGEYEDDPIFELDWLKRALVIDLMMQENQIPFFILKHLSNLINVSQPSPVDQGALYFFRCWDLFKKLGLNTTISHPKPKIHHLLHLLHTNMTFTERNDHLCYGKSISINFIQCASKLREAGVIFKKRNGAHKLLDVKFENGVMEIPPFTVEDTTYPVFFNLIAFEHSYRHCKKYFSAYTYFIDGLINTARDVEILCPKIIDNWLGSNEEVATLFNNMGKEVNIDYRNYCDLLYFFNEINKYCEKFYPRMRATLKHDYCRTPCAIISIVAAIFLLLLTVEQAFFSAVPKFALQNKGN